MRMVPKRVQIVKKDKVSDDDVKIELKQSLFGTAVTRDDFGR